VWHKAASRSPKHESPPRTRLSCSCIGNSLSKDIQLAKMEQALGNLLVGERLPVTGQLIQQT